MKNTPETNADPVPAVSTAPARRRGHRPRMGKEVRVHLSSTTVDVSTRTALADWQAETGRNLGGVLDTLVTFAAAHGFPQSITAVQYVAPCPTSNQA